jgi:hypothetical protein
MALVEEGVRMGWFLQWTRQLVLRNRVVDLEVWYIHGQVPFHPTFWPIICRGWATHNRKTIRSSISKNDPHYNILESRPSVHKLSRSGQLYLPVSGTNLKWSKLICSVLGSRDITEFMWEVGYHLKITTDDDWIRLTSQVIDIVNTNHVNLVVHINALDVLSISFNYINQIIHRRIFPK